MNSNETMDFESGWYVMTETSAIPSHFYDTRNRTICGMLSYSELLDESAARASKLDRCHKCEHIVADARLNSPTLQTAEVTA